MMLWEIIRNFFVIYVFGGTYVIDGTEYFADGALIGYFANHENGEELSLNTSSFYLPVNGWNDINGGHMQFISFADWLSTTATIITLIALLVAISMLIVSLTKWIIRLVSLRG